MANNSNKELNDEDILLDMFDGILPNKKFLIKIYCSSSEDGHQVKQQILDNQEIVQRLKAEVLRMELTYDVALADEISKYLKILESKHGKQ